MSKSKLYVCEACGLLLRSLRRTEPIVCEESEITWIDDNNGKQDGKPCGADAWLNAACIAWVGGSQLAPGEHCGEDTRPGKPHCHRHAVAEREWEI